eukprot:5761923-Pyramimonas_sp.AAC.1
MAGCLRAPCLAAGTSAIPGPSWASNAAQRHPRACSLSLAKTAQTPQPTSKTCAGSRNTSTAVLTISKVSTRQPRIARVAQKCRSSGGVGDFRCQNMFSNTHLF